MKYILAFLIFGMAGCNNPYTHPNTSRALSEKDQVEELKKQNILLEQQNHFLKRIAEALECENNKNSIGVIRVDTAIYSSHIGKP